MSRLEGVARACILVLLCGAVYEALVAFEFSAALLTRRLPHRRAVWSAIDAARDRAHLSLLPIGK